MGLVRAPLEGILLSSGENPQVGLHLLAQMSVVPLYSRGGVSPQSLCPNLVGVELQLGEKLASG